MADEKTSENIFEIMDGMLFKLNQTKRLFVIMILTILILPPIALLITTSVFDNPFRPNEDELKYRQQTEELHLELQKMTAELEGLPPDERAQKLDEFLNSDKYKSISDKLSTLPSEELMKQEHDGSSKQGFRFVKGPQMIIFVISAIWLGVGVRQWLVLSKFSKKYEKFKEKQKDIEEKLDENTSDNS